MIATILALLSRVPLSLYVGAAILAAALGWHFHDVHMKVAANDAKWEAKLAAEKSAYDKKVAAIQAQQQQVIYRTVVEYRDRVQIVKEKADVIVKEVEKLVPADAPALSGGMRVAHDAAATGDMPDDPAGAARAAAPIEEAAYAATVAENYGACRAEFVKLEALQNLVTNLERKEDHAQ